MRLLAILLVAALAGCLAEPESTQTTDPSADEPMDGNMTLEPKVYSETSTITVGAGSPAGGGQTGGVSVPFTIDAAATLIFAEVIWDNAAVDLDLHLKEPNSGDTTWQHSVNGGTPGNPDSPHNMTLSPSDAGTWQGGWDSTVFPNGPAADTTFTLAVTVFFGETEVPAGYTALA